MRPVASCGGDQRRSAGRRPKRCFRRRSRKASSNRNNCPPGSSRRWGWAAIRGRFRRFASSPTGCWSLAEERKRSAAHEARWLNLCGFCLRPGFGFPGDDFRIEQARRIYASGLQFANQVQNEIEWWIYLGPGCGRAQ